ncbi:hypothetical protein [Emticicia sp. BO119]|uniref:hypothetical protein n=1 Tax=Emticicia sp. BO119 TaxID=2757768 RepID=UPI0015F0342B|nr:hypothetical protein [Emticicia sp. BO119]MBA4853666.1 hypothetical protein [Emticicia sp. BO119]
MTHFSTKRLFLLIKKTWIENYRIWAIALGVLISLYCLFHFLTTDRTHIIAYLSRQTIYSIGLLISGTLFANFLWKDFSNKGQNINFLLLPATAFEKLLAAIFYASLIFPIVYIVLFFTLDAIYVHTIQSVVTVKIDTWDLNPLSFRDPHSFILSITLLFLVLQPIALLSSLLFEKHSYIKTALLVFIFFFSLIYLFTIIKRNILADTIGNKDFGGSIFTPTEIYFLSTDENVADTISIPSPTSYIINLTLTLGTALFFIFITFLKLKEKEI